MNRARLQRRSQKLAIFCQRTSFFIAEGRKQRAKNAFFLVIAGCFWIMNRARPQRWSLPLKVLKMGFNDFNNDIIIGAGTQ